MSGLKFCTTCQTPKPFPSGFPQWNGRFRHQCTDCKNLEAKERRRYLRALAKPENYHDCNSCGRIFHKNKRKPKKVCPDCGSNDITDFIGEEND